MLSAIWGIVQIVLLFLKNKFEKNDDVRKQKESLREEAAEAVKSGDISRINAVLGKLRR